jgi:AcrR family transcriptional regulator
VTRPYDNTLRRAQAAETRAGIVAAGCRLLQRSSIRDWRGLTIRAVAQEAGVSERTVFRHFANERGVRDAVLRRLEQEAGVDLDGLTLDALPALVGRVLATIARYPRPAGPPLDPTLTEAGARQRAALVGALGDWSDGWSEAETTAVAATLDLLWSVASFERLVVDWGLDEGEATAALTWLVGLIARAAREADRPALRRGPARVPARLPGSGGDR